MPTNDKVQALYDQLTTDGYNLGDYNTFATKLDNPEKVKSLYEGITKDGYNVGDFDTFSSKIGSAPMTRPQEQSYALTPEIKQGIDIGNGGSVKDAQGNVSTPYPRKGTIDSTSINTPSVEIPASELPQDNNRIVIPTLDYGVKPLQNDAIKPLQDYQPIKLATQKEAINPTNNPKIDVNKPAQVKSRNWDQRILDSAIQSVNSLGGGVEGAIGDYYQKMQDIWGFDWMGKLADKFSLASAEVNEGAKDFKKNNPEEGLPEMIGGILPMAAATVADVYTGGALTPAIMGTFGVSGYGDGIRMYDDIKSANGEQGDDLARTGAGLGYSAVMLGTMNALTKFGVGGVQKLAKSAVLPEIISNVFKSSPKAFEGGAKELFEAYAKAQPSIAGQLLKNGVHSVATMEGMELSKMGINALIGQKQTLKDWTNTATSAAVSGLLFTAVAPFSIKYANDANLARIMAQKEVTIAMDGKNPIELIPTKNGMQGRTPDNKLVKVTPEMENNSFTIESNHFIDLLKQFKQSKTVDPNLERNVFSNRVAGVLKNFITDKGNIQVAVDEQGNKLYISGKDENGNLIGVNGSGEVQPIPENAKIESAPVGDVHESIMAEYDKQQKNGDKRDNSDVLQNALPDGTDNMESIVNPTIPEDIDPINPTSHVQVGIETLQTQQAMEKALEGMDFTFDPKVAELDPQEQHAILLQVLEDEKLSDEQKQSISDYLNSVAVSKQLHAQRQIARNNQLQFVNDELRGSVNQKTGTLVRANIKGDENAQNVFVTGGLAIKTTPPPSGTPLETSGELREFEVDPENSDETIFYKTGRKNANGTPEVLPTTIDNLEVVDQSDLEQTISETQAAWNDHFQKQDNGIDAAVQEYFAPTTSPNPSQGGEQNQDPLQGISSGDTVNYIDDNGDQQSGIIQIDPVLRQEGKVFINDEEWPMENVLPKQSQEPSAKSQDSVDNGDVADNKQQPTSQYPELQDGTPDFNNMTDEQVINYTRETKGEEAANALVQRQVKRLQGQISENQRATAKHTEDTNKLLAKSKTMQEDNAIEAKQAAKAIALKEEFTTLSTKLAEMQTYLPKVEAPAPVETPQQAPKLRPEIAQLQKEEAERKAKEEAVSSKQSAVSSEEPKPIESAINDENPAISGEKNKINTPFQQRQNNLGDYVDMEDYILRAIAGGLKFKWKTDGVKKGMADELGFGDKVGERRNYLNLIDEKNGITPQDFAHNIWNEYGEDGNAGEIPGVRNMTDQDILNLVHDVLRATKSNTSALEQAEAKRNNFELTPEDYGIYDSLTPQEINYLEQIPDDILESYLGITNFTPEQLDYVTNLQNEYGKTNDQSANSSPSERNQGLESEESIQSGQSNRQEVVEQKFLTEKEFIKQYLLDYIDKNGISEQDFEDSDSYDDIFNEASDTYPEYITELKNTGKLQEWFDSAKLGDKISIRKGTETAGFEVNDFVDTNKEKNDSKAKREEEKKAEQERLFKSIGIDKKSNNQPKEPVLSQPQLDTQELDTYIAEQDHNTNPTDKQKETGIYPKARVNLQHHNITIETLKGTERSGIDEGGQKWSVTMQNHYGELDGTVGYDNDPIDVFIGPNPKQGEIFVVDQILPDGSFDESKVMLGFDSAEEAKAAYMSNYSEGWDGFGSITPAGDNFKAWLYDGKKQKKPFAEYVGTPKAVETSGDNGDVADNKTQLTPSERYDNATTPEERHAAAVEIVQALEKTLHVGTTPAQVLKSTDEFMSTLKTHISDAEYQKAEQYLASGQKLAAVRLGGKILINMEHNFDAKVLTESYMHETAHKAFDVAFRGEDLSNLDIPNIQDYIPSVYWGEDNAMKATEVVAHYVEELLNKYTPEQIKNGEIDLSLLNEDVQYIVTKTLNKLTNGKIDSIGQERFNDLRSISASDRGIQADGHSGKNDVGETGDSKPDNGKPGTEPRFTNGKIISKTKTPIGTEVKVKYKTPIGAETKIFYTDGEIPMTFNTEADIDKFKESLSGQVQSEIKPETERERILREKLDKLRGKLGINEKPEYKISEPTGKLDDTGQLVSDNISIGKDIPQGETFAEWQKSKLPEWTDYALQIVNKVANKQYLEQMDLQDLATIYNAAVRNNYQGWEQSDINDVVSILVHNNIFRVRDEAERKRYENIYRAIKNLQPEFKRLDSETTDLALDITEMLFEDGDVSFPDYSARMIEAMGEGIKPYLSGFYELSRVSVPQEGMTPAAEVANFDIKNFNHKEYVSNRPRNSQPNSTPANEVRPDADLIPVNGAGSGSMGSRSPKSGGKTVGQPSGKSRGDLQPTLFGEQSDNELLPTESAVEKPATGDTDGRGNGIDSPERHLFDGGTSESGHQDNVGLPETFKERTARKIIEQRNAEYIPVQLMDEANVRETLPLLLPEQQDDVLKAENRFFGEQHKTNEAAHGKGMLFTNGTGTGKTYTGLGIAKRFDKQGKKNILIVVPSEAKIGDWVQDGQNIGLSITPLTSTKDAGQNAVITTYANFRANDALKDRDFDLVMYDESHRLMEEKSGATSSTTNAHYGHSNVSEWQAFNRLQSINPAYQEIEALYEQIRTARDKRPLEEKVLQLQKAYNQNVKLVLQERAKRAYENTKVVFLSATPFKGHFNLKYANGSLFDWGNETITNGRGSRVNPEAQFYLNNFGSAYEWKFHRLQKKQNSNAEAVAMQEIEFSQRLMAQGAMSGRAIESDKDYSREFPLVALDKAEVFNQALNEIYSDEFGELSEAAHKVFNDYNYTTKLFESLKASMNIQRIQDHLDLGRKVIVFHRRKQANVLPPFQSILDQTRQLADQYVSEAVETNDIAKKAELIHKANEMRKKSEQFETKYADLLTYEQTLNYDPSITQINEAFPGQVVSMNGDTPKKDKSKNVALFNDDNSGKNIIVVQEEAGKEGISLHDTTGKHQRVLISLSLPISSTTALQIEGRPYRIGNESDAIFEYPLLGLDQEISDFGQKINKKLSTTENLAIGDQARDLLRSFAEGVLFNSGTDAPNLNQGKGGKEYDKKAQETLSEFRKAVLVYNTNQKTTGRRDQREGTDYYATPEPVGQKMVDWLGLQAGETAMEPSAGHGAIAMWFPEKVNVTVVEPSYKLFSKLNARAGGGGRKMINDIFENLNVINKFNGVAMNPPFGSGGKTAVEHVAKAFDHLQNNGRIVAIIPQGQADGRLDKFLEENNNAHLVASIKLPSVTFEQAGTKVGTRIVVIDRIDLPTEYAVRQEISKEETNDIVSGKRIGFMSKEEKAAAIEKRMNEIRAELPRTQNMDLSGDKNIDELFNEIEDLSVEPRQNPSASLVPLERGQSEGEVVAENTNEGKLLPVEEFVHTQTGQKLYNVKINGRSDDYTTMSDIAKKFNPYNAGRPWNKFSKGFLFADRNDAVKFKNEVEEVKPEYKLVDENDKKSLSPSEKTQNKIDSKFPTPEYKIIGEKGAANLDKAEEATTRLDNLKVAREMEKTFNKQSEKDIKDGWLNENYAFVRQTKDNKLIRLATGWEKGVDGLWRYEVPDGKFSKRMLQEKHDGQMKLSEAWEDEQLFKTYPQLKDIDVDMFVGRFAKKGGSFNPETNKIIIAANETEQARSIMVHEIQHTIQHEEGFAQGGSVDMFSNSRNNTRRLFTDLDEAFDKLGYTEWLKNADDDTFKKIMSIDKNFAGMYVFAETQSENVKSKMIKKLDEADAVIKENDAIFGKHGRYADIKDTQLYHNLSGEVEARNASTRMNLTPEERQQRLLSETADVAPEEQIVLMDGLGVSESVPEKPEFTPEKPLQQYATEINAYNEKIKAIEDRKQELKKKRDDKTISNVDFEKQAQQLNVEKSHLVEKLKRIEAGTSKPEDFEEVGSRQSAVGSEENTTVSSNKQAASSEGTKPPTPPTTSKATKLAAEAGENISEKLRDELDSKIGRGEGKLAFRLQEAYQDQHLAVKEFQEVLKNNGMKITPMNDWYMRVTALGGMNDSQMDYYEHHFNLPIMKEVNRMEKISSYRDIENYMMQKHGLERNEWMSQEEAKKELDKKYNFDEYDQQEKSLNKQAEKLDEQIKSADENTETENLKKQLSDVYKELTQLEKKRKFREKMKDAEFNGIKNTLEEAEANKWYENQKEYIDNSLQNESITPEEYEKRVKNLDIIFEKGYKNKYEAKDYSGITAIEEETGMPAQQYIDEFEAKHDVTRFWELINKATKNATQTQFDNGMLDKETFEDLKTRYKYYIPLRGFDKEIAEDRYDYSPDMGTHFVAPLIKAKGRTSRPETPFAYIFSMNHSAITQSNKNNLNQAWVRLARQDKSGTLILKQSWYKKVGETDEGQPIWEQQSPEWNADPTQYGMNIQKFEEDMAALAEKGEAVQKRGKLNIGLFVKPKQAKQHELHVYENGTEHVVYINANPKVARAINGDNRVEAGAFFDGLSMVNRWMAANFTSRNPLFMVTNFERDITFATTTLGVKEGIVYQAHFVGNVPHAVKAITNVIAGKGEVKTKYDKYAEEFILNGGKTGYTHIVEIKSVQKRIEEEIKSGKVHEPGFVFKAFELGNLVAENTTRLATYITSREAGRGIHESISNAKEVTVNFNRKGSGAMGADAMRKSFLFFNVAVQALDNITGIAKKHPYKLAALLASFVASGLLAPILAGLLGGDEAEEAYNNLSDYDRQNNWCIWTGSGFLKWALPQELRVFHALGDNVYRHTQGKVTNTELAVNTMIGLTDLLPVNPMGAMNSEDKKWKMVANSVTPDVIKPFMQLALNVTYTGGSAYNPFANDADPGFVQASKNKKGEPFAPAVLVWAAQQTDNLTGGDGVKPGAVSPNPDIINHLMRGYMGGLYTIAIKSVDTGDKLIEGKDVKLRDTPISTLYTSKDDIMENNSRMRKEYNEVKAEINDEKHYVSKYKSGAMDIYRQTGDLSKTAEYTTKMQALSTQKFIVLKQLTNGITKLEGEIEDAPNGEELQKRANELKGFVIRINKANAPEEIKTIMTELEKSAK